MKRIIHIDMDAFFASIEQVKNPELQGKPVIVGGKKGDRRGVVSTCSYEARAFGVHSAMPLIQAQKLCPHGIYLPGSSAEYSVISKKIRTLLFEVSPVVEMASIDEGYIDITGSLRLFSGEAAIVDHLKNRIFEETGLNCTIGTASNRLIAKIASGAGKPNGYLSVPDGEEAGFLAPMNVSKIPGIGPKMCETLSKMGIYKVSDLQVFSQDSLIRRFGNWGLSLHRVAHGQGSDVLHTTHIPKSMSRETTFSTDATDWDRIESVLSYLMERTLYSLREAGMEGRRLTVKARSGSYETHTYSTTLVEPTSLDSVVSEHIAPLIASAQCEVPCVRLIGFHIGELSSGHHQLLLGEMGHSEQWEKALEGVDALRGRYGFQALRSGKSMRLGKDVKLSNPSLSK